MAADDALAFCRRRFETARERSGDLEHASSLLRDDDLEAERTWSDAFSLELRHRDLEPHRSAADRQKATLDRAIEAGGDLLGALDEAARAETATLAAIAKAQAAVQSAVAATELARRELDQARVSLQTAERECAEADQMVAALT
jgi:hypothetical protein